MASLISRNMLKIVRPMQSFVLASRRPYSDDPYIEPHKNKAVVDKAKMPDQLGHSVGKERFELLANYDGEPDPFDHIVHNKAHGTKEEPTIVESAMDYRVIGCVCEEHTMALNFFMLNKGEPSRCECGYWFELVDVVQKDFGQF